MLLKVLAEPLRWRILELLATEELCVCHLVESPGCRPAAGQPPPADLARRRSRRDRASTATGPTTASGPPRSRPSATALTGLAKHAPPRRARDAVRAAEPMTATWAARPRPRPSAPRCSSPSSSAPASPRSASRPTTSACSCSRTRPPRRGGLVALILAFGSVSGAHFNPVVTLADRFFGGLTTGEAVALRRRAGRRRLRRRDRRQPDVRPRRDQRSRPTPARPAGCGSARSSPRSGC